MRIPRVALIWACLAGLMTSAGACQSSVTPSAAPATTTTTTTTQSPSASLTVANPTPSAAPTTKRPTPHPSATVAARRPAPAPKPAAPKPAPPKPAPPKPAPPTPPGCAVPWGLTARQVVLVDAHGSGATIRACERSGSRYLQVLGPYAGHVGTKGVSWSKVEGDMHTPAGVFPLRNGFGVNRNPGLGAGSWLRVDSLDVWVDDPESAFYNTHQRLPVDDRWDSAERMQLSPAYNYAQVIGYNEARTPYRGSAIFLHVDQGRGTAGCVSLPTAALLSVMRWERAGAVIAITP